MINVYGHNITNTNVLVWFSAIVGSAIVIVLMINLIIRLILAAMLKGVTKKHGKDTTPEYILSTLYRMISKPLRWSSWLMGVWSVVFAFSRILDVKYELDTNINISVFTTIIELIVTFLFIRMFFHYTYNLREHFKKVFTRNDGSYNDFSTINTLHRISQVVIVIVSFFIIMAILNISLTSLAFLSTAVLGFIAFSQQELIKNIFGGVVLYFDQPFSEGDWITAMDGSFEGTVSKISFRITKFIGFDSRPFYIPNSFFLAKGIINNNRMSNRRILQYIGLRYKDFSKIEKVIEDIREYLKNHPRIDQTKTTLVNVVNGKTNMGSSIEGVFGSYSINIMIYTFTNQTAWVEFQNIQDDVMFGIGKVIERNGAAIAFPTQTIDFSANELSQALTHNN